jgi:hypothetical protein
VRVAGRSGRGVATVTVGFPGWDAIEFARRTFEVEVTE